MVTASQPIRVMLVEDHPIARLGLRGLLEDDPGFALVAEAADGVEALAVYTTARPDVVVMDLRMPRFDGIQTTAALCQQDSAVRILVLSSYDSEQDVARIMHAGAKGYVMKEAQGDEVLRAIRQVAEGGEYLSDSVARRLHEARTSTALNARERRILELMAKGLSNAQIADMISLKTNTVRVYTSDLFAKLGVGNRAEAVSVAIERGIIRRG
ncbi:MAG: response regulator transcription factor [Myxococcales bacterium]|nr:response regulator transcription factor [Myxococcales bacterium]